MKLVTSRRLRADEMQPPPRRGRRGWAGSLPEGTPRLLGVVDPLRLRVVNWPDPAHVEWLEAPLLPGGPLRRLPFGPELLVERGDLALAKGRLAVGAAVKLRFGFEVVFESLAEDDAGELTEVLCRYDASTRTRFDAAGAVRGRLTPGVTLARWVHASLHEVWNFNSDDRAPLAITLPPSGVVRCELAIAECLAEEEGTLLHLERLGLFRVSRSISRARVLESTCPAERAPALEGDAVRWPRRPEGGGAALDRQEEKQEAAGDLRRDDLSLEEVLARLVQDVDGALADAAPYACLEACAPSPELRGRLRAIADGAGSYADSTWAALARLRIKDSWRSRREELIWLDDKVMQVDVAASLCGEAVHMPLLAHAAAGDAEGLDAVRAAVRFHVAEGAPLVVKPRHGANSVHVYLWPHPQQAGEAAVLESVEVALNSTDRSWDRECWQLAQVPRGVVLQPMYQTELPAAAAPAAGAAIAMRRHLNWPLEVGVVVIFGAVLGGTLNRHPFEVWVTPGGAVQRWRPEKWRECGLPGARRVKNILEDGALEVLQEQLRRNWPRMRRLSELLVRRAGLDELRVDWLLGDERWGARVGELTYIGAGGPFPIPQLSEGIALAFSRGHLR